MSNYTPPTEVIRQACTFERNRLGEPRTISVEKFDRWLESVKREAAAVALESIAARIEQDSIYGGAKLPKHALKVIRREAAEYRDPRTPGEETE